MTAGRREWQDAPFLDGNTSIGNIANLRVAQAVAMSDGRANASVCWQRITGNPPGHRDRLVQQSTTAPLASRRQPGVAARARYGVRFSTARALRRNRRRETPGVCLGELQAYRAAETTVAQPLPSSRPQFIRLPRGAPDDRSRQESEGRQLDQRYDAMRKRYPRRTPTRRSTPSSHATLSWR